MSILTPIEDDARKFVAAHPYTGWSNICAGDGYFDMACRNKYGEEAWSAAVKDVAARKFEIAAAAMGEHAVNQATAAAQATIAAAAPDALATAVAELRKSRAMQKGAWTRVIEAGRAYALMKANGIYIERGGAVSVGHNERARMIDHFQENLLREVERAFAEDALMGAAIADAT